MDSERIQEAWYLPTPFCGPGAGRNVPSWRVVIADVDARGVEDVFIVMSRSSRGRRATIMDVVSVHNA
jgi:hypothetical protein